MILTLDLGNTNLFIGVCDDKRVLETYRTSTDPKKSGDEYAFILQSMLETHIQKGDISAVICSSVVPSLNNALKLAVRKLFNLEVMFVKTGLKTGLAIRIDNPNETGADLVCDCVGALAKYGPGVLIADLGTATKMLVVDKNKAFIGGIISAGLKISIEALAGKTANLSETALEVPNKIIGTNTIDCINIGTIKGSKLMIEGFAQEMEREIGYPLKRIATGGFSHVLTDLKDFTYDENLILEGLLLIYQKNRKGDNHD